MTNKPIDPNDILIELNWAEDDDLEFKSARGGLPKSLWKSIASVWLPTNPPILG